MKSEEAEKVKSFFSTEFSRIYANAFHDGAKVTIKSVRSTFEKCIERLHPEYQWTTKDIFDIITASEEMIEDAHKIRKEELGE